MMRQKLRSLRKTISPAKRHIFSKNLLFNLLKTNILKAKNIALYLPNDGEIETKFIINFLKNHNKNIYLPVIFGEKLKFAKINNKFKTNKFNIPEPNNSQIIDGKKINIVLVPLVAFDERLNRVGMGGGFYDKTFNFKLKQKIYKYPKLYGLAYHLQKYNIKPNSWDIKLNKIITNKFIL